VPTAVATNLTFSSLVAGHDHTCGIAVSPPGAAYCWGYNVDGELGDGTAIEQHTPVAVIAGGLSFSALASGSYHTCGLAVSPRGFAYCWGYNAYGQLGDGSTNERRTPVAVNSGGLSFSTLSHGPVSHVWPCYFSSRSCILLGARRITESLATEPRQIDTYLSPSAAAGLTFCTCLRQFRPYLCTGDIAFWRSLLLGMEQTTGQLGDGTTTLRLVPVAVSTGGLTFFTCIGLGALLRPSRLSTRACLLGIQWLWTAWRWYYN